MHVAIPVVALAVGLAVGTLYGRKAEQKAVSLALSEYAKVNSAARATLEGLRTRLSYLKKVV